MEAESPSNEWSSLRPIEGANRSIRRRLELRHELVLALLPTAMVLCVLVMLESLSRQRLLFASLLASSAFLIYLDPRHEHDSDSRDCAPRGCGLGADWTFSSGYVAAAAMVITILFMVLADVVHPPVISTALSFAFRAGDI